MAMVTITNNSSCMIILPTYHPSADERAQMKKGRMVMSSKINKGNIHINVGQTVSVPVDVYERQRKGSRAFKAMISQRNILVSEGGVSRLDDEMTNTSAALELPEDLKPIEDTSVVGKVTVIPTASAVEAAAQDEANAKQITNAASEDAAARKAAASREAPVNSSSKVGQYEGEPDSADLV